MKRTIALCACLLVACSPDPETEPTVDSGSDASSDTAADAADAEPNDARANDAAPVDAGDAGVDLPPGDTGPNTNVDITATVAETTEGFERAFYGITTPEQSASGEWELHVEVYAGGAPGCPQMDSPTPDRTLVIGGLKFPEVPTEQREEDGVAIALLDFQGTLTDQPTMSATGEIVYFQRWELCTDCQGDDPDGYLSFDVDALLEGGNVRGHVYATHCASLNSP